MVALGLPLFELTQQRVLERADATCEEAPLVPYLDTKSVGQFMPAASSIRRLCVDGVGIRSTRLEPRQPQCSICGNEKEMGIARVIEAAKLRIKPQLHSFTADCTPLGSAEYVSSGLGRRTATAETLVRLSLSIQSHFLPMRASLPARIERLIRIVPRKALATHMRRTDAAVWRGAAAVLDIPQGVGEDGADMEGPDKECSTLGRQTMRPLRHRGLGLHMQ